MSGKVLRIAPAAPPAPAGRQRGIAPRVTATTPWEQVPHALTVEEAGILLGVCKDSVYAAIASGDVPHLRIGNRLVVPKLKLAPLLGLPTSPAGAASAESRPEVSQ